MKEKKTEHSSYDKSRVQHLNNNNIVMNVLT